VSIAPQAHTRESIESWLIDWIARELGMPPADLQTSKSLLDYSLSSVTAMMLVGDLEERLGLTLPPTLVWDYPSIAAIAEFLMEQLDATAAGAKPGVEPVGGPEAGRLAALDGLSDQEVDALLSRMMADPGTAIAP
jgi:acyl carrier protein